MKTSISDGDDCPDLIVALERYTEGGEKKKRVCADSIYDFSVNCN